MGDDGTAGGGGEGDIGQGRWPARRVPARRRKNGCWRKPVAAIRLPATSTSSTMRSLLSASGGRQGGLHHRELAPYRRHELLLGRLDLSERHRVGSALGSLPLHTPQTSPLFPGGLLGIRHHDEPESPGSEGPAADGAGLRDQPEGGVGDRGDPREDRGVARRAQVPGGISATARAFWGRVGCDTPLSPSSGP